MEKLGQAWYEKAADTIASSYTRPEDRLAVLNELWGEYLFIANRKVAGFTVSYERPDALIRSMVDGGLMTYAGFNLEELVKFAKEMMKNGTNEAQAATADAEQLG